MSSTTVLSLGSNLGDRSNYLFQARENICRTIGKSIQNSAIYETEPWGLTEQNAYLNQVVEIETTMSPVDILSAIQAIEELLGRIRTLRYGPRTLDIDILYIGQTRVENERLQIPHPQIAHRRFLLVPLSEILPDFVHPVLGFNHRELLNLTADLLTVKRWTDESN